MLSQIQPKLLPSIKMTARSHSPAPGPLRLPITNILPESACALDRRLIHLLMLPYIVDGAVACDAADPLALSGTSAVAGEFLDVVFD